MDPLIFRYIREVFKQLHRNVHYFLIGVGLISFVVLTAGLLYDPKFETSVTIYADTQNVIKPLLEGQATITVPKNERIRIVREIMFTPRLLEQVIKSSYENGNLIESGSTEMEAAMAELRKETEISAPADNYIKVAYRHEQAEISYKVVNKLTNLFIDESAQSKRAESKNAYTFIDEQVKSYKSQLVEAENKLKAFEAANVDGGEGEVNSSIDRLRNAIDEISIDIEAEQVRIAALEEQLASESRYATSDYNARVYRDRLAQLESQLDTLKINFRDEHPDVIDIKLQIQDLKRTIVQVEESTQNESAAEDLTGDRNLNPIYEELSSQLSESKVSLQTMKHRLAANENRLQQRYQRRIRIAGNQANLSELTRDYSVTKGIYEDLLERKERARISMTLDLSGKGVSYKVLEPAVFPVTPSGVQFILFVIGGPVLGIIISSGVLVATVFFDNRIKFPEQLNDLFPGIVLAVLPPENTPHHNWRVIGAVAAATLITYAGAAITHQFI